MIHVSADFLLKFEDIILAEDFKDCKNWDEIYQRCDELYKGKLV